MVAPDRTRSRSNSTPLAARTAAGASSALVRAAARGAWQLERDARHRANPRQIVVRRDEPYEKTRWRGDDCLRGAIEHHQRMAVYTEPGSFGDGRKRGCRLGHPLEASGSRAGACPGAHDAMSRHRFERVWRQAWDARNRARPGATDEQREGTEVSTRAAARGMPSK